MFAHIKTLVGSIDNQCIVKQPFLFQIIKHAAYIVVKRLHRLHIIAHITLELPVGEFLSLKVLFIKIINDRSIEFIPGGTLPFIHPSDKSLIQSFQAGFLIGTQHLQIINHVHILHDAHLLGSRCRTALIIIEEIIRQWESLILKKR